MCGIFAVFNYGGDLGKFRSRAIALSKRIRHRGPDWTGCLSPSSSAILCHERLAIVGVGMDSFYYQHSIYACQTSLFNTLLMTLFADSGAQPLTSEDGSVILCVNGEIYNHKSLKRHLKKDHVFKTKSDCEVILHLVRGASSLQPKST